MSQPFRLFLTDIVKFNVRGLLDFLQNVELSFLLQRVLELEGDVEVILDRPFPFAGNDDDVLDAGCDRFFHDILNGRLIQDRKHFFRHCFGCGQKSCTESSRWNNRFSHFFHLISPYPSFLSVCLFDHDAKNTSYVFSLTE